MICVTGFEPDLLALEARFADSARRAPAVRLLHELRLDAVTDAASVIAGLAPLEGPRLDPRQMLSSDGRALRLVCCRPTREGGRYAEDETSRLALLRVAAAKADLVDVEVDVDDAWVAALRATNPGLLVVRSKHVFEDPGPPEVEPVLHRTDSLGRVDRAQHAAPLQDTKPTRFDCFRSLDGDLFKLAVAIDDARELHALHEDVRTLPGAFVIGMGPAGLLSRVLYSEFGAPWTYVAASESSRTASGQLTLEGALKMGLGAETPPTPYVLVGGPQVMHSPGWSVYNTLFRALDLNAVYLPVVSTRPEIFEFLSQLGVRAASVTMPLKQALFEQLDPSTLDEEVRALGVANSVRFDSPWCAMNSDVVGVQQPLGAALELLELRGGQAVILGAGGAAKAARRACENLGLACVTAARSPIDGAFPWAERGELSGRALINATPLLGERDPWPSDSPLNFDVVFDMPFSEEPSALLQRADDEGLLTLTALDMWLVQGAAQMSFFLGRQLTRHDLARALPPTHSVARRQLKGPSCLS